MGSAIVLTLRLSISAWMSSKSAIAGLIHTPPIVLEVAMCLPACALIWFSSEVKVLIAVWMLPLLIAAWAADSLLVSALATPALSMAPADRNSVTSHLILSV